ncbi:MAG TPA: c-type cytochrome [Candidatus Limnocylindria bacterium]|nr:c-type cytochrome [Candidatus Limnocylindria bacterium]
MKRLEIAAVVLALFAIVGVPAAAFAYDRTQHAPDEITVVARQYENGGWSPSTIAVKNGQIVRLRITSADVAHSLYIPSLRLESDLILPGHWVRLEFRATGDGELRLKCNVACGVNHAKMTATLVVGTGVAAAATPGLASPPGAGDGSASAAPDAVGGADAAQIALGKKVFETAGGDGCQSCHGPDARGQTTKSGTVAPNIRGATERKLRDALAGGAALMTFLKLSDEEIEAVIKYLESLDKQ